MTEDLPPREPAPGEPHRRDIEAVARDWVLQLMDRDDKAITDACAAWRAADPLHDTAFWGAWTIWAGLGRTDSAQSDAWRNEAAELKALPTRIVAMPQVFFRGHGRWAVPMGLAASIAALVTFGLGSSPAGLDVATGVAETRVITLVDGSTMTVGGKSEVKAFVNKQEREVRVEEGQAFFDVAHDSAHPFKVLAGDAEITVRGTKFDVRRIGDDVKVSVLEGRVEVRRRGMLSFLSVDAPDAVLTAGQKSELVGSAGAFAAAAPALAPAGEWRSGRLYYADAPLSEIIADARRYSARRIDLVSGGAGSMSLTVSYRAGDVESLADAIEDALPVKVERRNDGLAIVPSGEK